MQEEDQGWMERGRPEKTSVCSVCRIEPKEWGKEQRSGVWLGDRVTIWLGHRPSENLLPRIPHPSEASLGQARWV